MIHAVFSSDWHIGLKVEGRNMFPYIRDVAKKIYGECKKLQASGEVDLILGGDIFDNNYPTEEEIAGLIGILNNFINVTTHIYILVGNHEPINDGTRTSCLSFLQKIQKRYETISLIDNASWVRRATYDCGHIDYLFLPHITKAISNGGDVQKYLNQRLETIFDKRVERGDNLIVFSHLDVAGAKRGSEERMMKTTTLKIPSILTEDCPYGYNTPLILNGHIHSPSEMGNCKMIGSPIYTDFKDCNDDNKYFAVVNIADSLSNGIKLNMIPTNPPRFREFEFDVFSCDDFKTIYDVAEFQNFMNGVKKGDFVKVSLKIDSERSKLIDFKSLKTKIELDTGCVVKDIVPTVILQSKSRNPEQKIGLSIVESIKVFLRNSNVTEKKIKFELSKLYVGKI
jgi:DNA repair exonuclease SbcCD nuclease subunit